MRPHGAGISSHALRYEADARSPAACRASRQQARRVRPHVARPFAHDRRQYQVICAFAAIEVVPKIGVNIGEVVHYVVGEIRDLRTDTVTICQ